MPQTEHEAVSALDLIFSGKTSVESNNTPVDVETAKVSRVAAKLAVHGGWSRQPVGSPSSFVFKSRRR